MFKKLESNDWELSDFDDNGYHQYEIYVGEERFAKLISWSYGTIISTIEVWTDLDGIPVHIFIKVSSNQDESKTDFVNRIIRIFGELPVFHNVPPQTDRIFISSTSIDFAGSGITYNKKKEMFFVVVEIPDSRIPMFPGINTSTTIRMNSKDLAELLSARDRINQERGVYVQHF